MALKMHLGLLLLVFGLSQPVFAGPPCKTPEELRQAFEACLRTGDTNQFWKLHCWTNVSPKDEAMHKNLTRDSVVHPEGKTLKRMETKVVPAPREANTWQPLTKRGGVLKPNIPVTGAIAYRQNWGGFEVENWVEFGKRPDGTYWLVVPIFVSTNAAGK